VTDMLLFQQLWKMNKPILGICRGFQFFTVALGGSLYQDISELFNTNVSHQQTPPYSKPAHTVYIEDNSLLHRIVQKNCIEVNSCHHQGVKKLPKELKPVAYAEDGLIEAVTSQEKSFFLGVQWHPELNYQVESSSRLLFEAFVKACMNGE